MTVVIVVVVVIVAAFDANEYTKKIQVTTVFLFGLVGFTRRVLSH